MRPLPARSAPRVGPWALAALTFGATLVSAGCASTASDTSDSTPVVEGGAAGMQCLTGVVVAEGVDIAPRTLVERPDGGPVELLGERVGNVRLLTGTTVRVCGSERTAERALEVTSVDLLEVDGMPAALGRLREVDVFWQLDPLDGGTPLDLIAVPEGLERAVDQVVWVAGDRERSRLTVRSFGVLEGWR